MAIYRVLLIRGDVGDGHILGSGGYENAGLAREAAKQFVKDYISLENGTIEIVEVMASKSSDVGMPEVHYKESPNWQA